MRTPIAAVALAALAACVVSSASGSVCVTAGAYQPSLRVNSHGTAEVRWLTASGASRYAIITPTGLCKHQGVRMAGRDVSHRVTGVHIPFRGVVKQTPDGAFWALQSWRRRPTEAPELRFSRWRGEPARVTAAATCCRNGREVLRGQVVYHGRTVARARVHLDCYRCSLNPAGWAPLTSTQTTSTGMYALVIRQEWEGSRYRVTLVGPNFGWVRAPDMRAVTSSTHR